MRPRSALTDATDGVTAHDRPEGQRGTRRALPAADGEHRRRGCSPLLVQFGRFDSARRTAPRSDDILTGNEAGAAYVAASLVQEATEATRLDERGRTPMLPVEYVETTATGR